MYGLEWGIKGEDVPMTAIGIFDSIDFAVCSNVGRGRRIMGRTGS